MIRRALARARFKRDHRWTGAHVSDYLDDELRPDERRRLEEHVHWCPECRHLLETMRRTVAGLMGLRTAPETSVAPGVIDRIRREG